MAADQAGDDPWAQARFEPAQLVRLDEGFVLVFFRRRHRIGGRAARIGGFVGRSLGGELRLVVRQAQAQGDKRGDAHQREDHEGAGQADAGQHHQGRERGADHGAEAEARRDQGQRLRPLGARRPAGDIGLHRRRRGAAEAAVKAARGGEQDQRPERGQIARQPQPEHQSAQREADREAGEAQRHHRLAAPAVGPARPERRADHPQQGRPAIGEADPHIRNAQRRADGRHD